MLGTVRSTRRTSHAMNIFKQSQAKVAPSKHTAEDRKGGPTTPSQPNDATQPQHDNQVFKHGTRNPYKLSFTMKSAFDLDIGEELAPFFLQGFNLHQAATTSKSDRYDRGL